MLLPSGPVVIDWRNARDGEPPPRRRHERTDPRAGGRPCAEGCHEARAMLPLRTSRTRRPASRLAEALQMRRRDANLTRRRAGSAGARGGTRASQHLMPQLRRRSTAALGT
jgi:hypothetical protein